MEHYMLKLRLHYEWYRILRLRKKGQRRLARGAALHDAKLRRWSHDITSRGLRLHHLEQQYLDRLIDKR